MLDVLRRIYRRWLAPLLVATALANLVAAAFVPTASQSVRRHESGSLTHLVHKEQRSVDRRYGIYIELGDALAGGTLVVYPGVELSADLARGLAGVEFEELDYDPTVQPGFVPESEPLGSFEAGDVLIDYWIVPDGKSNRWWLGTVPGGVVVLPETTAPVPEAES